MGHNGQWQKGKKSATNNVDSIIPIPKKMQNVSPKKLLILVT